MCIRDSYCGFCGVDFNVFCYASKFIRKLKSHTNVSILINLDMVDQLNEKFPGKLVDILMFCKCHQCGMFTLTDVLARLNAERAELANGVKSEHPALVAFTKHQNIDQLSRELLDRKSVV